LKDLSLFVTLDRKRAMQPFTVASDRTTIPQGYCTARFEVTCERGSQLTVTLPGCYLDDTLPFNLLSVSQLLHAGTISNPDFTRRELHFLDGPGFVDAEPRTRTVPMSSEGGLYNLRLTPIPRLVAQAASGDPPRPAAKLKEPMVVLSGAKGTVDWQLVRSCVRKYASLYGNELGVFDMDLFTDGLGPILGNSQCEEYCAPGPTSCFRPDFQWIHRCFYGNPPWVAHVIQRMFEKAAADFLLAPEDTSFLFVVPYMYSASWFHFTRSYHVVHIHRKADSARMFSRLRVGTYRPAALTDAGDEGCHGTSCLSCGLDNIYIYLYSRPSRPHTLMW
jgi:hypothetical protein